ERLSVPDYFALWQAIADISGDPSVGIRLAESVQPELMEPLFLAILSAADVIAALETLSRFKRLLHPESIDVRPDDVDRQVVVTYDWPGVEVPVPQILIDAELALIVEMCRRCTRTPALAPRAIHLRASALPDGSYHAAYFRCPIHLGAPRNGIALE